MLLSSNCLHSFVGKRVARVLICFRNVFITSGVTSVIMPCDGAAREHSSPRGSVEIMYNS